MTDIQPDTLPSRHPCTGYTAALGDLVIKIEHYTRQHNVTFGDVIRTININDFSNRFFHIINKYEVSADTAITKMYEMHTSWQDDTT